MTKHIYSIGQRVSFDGRVGTYLKRAGVFTITKLLPPVGAELQYRIKSEGEAHERVASEHELQAVELEKSIVAAGSQSSPGEANAARVFAGIV
jgi:hypothetical protein